MPEQDDRKRALRTMKTFSGGSSNPPPVKASRAVLTVQSGADAGRVVPLSHTLPNAIGRAEECTVALADARLSRVHARLTFAGGAWMLSDEGSTNGTFVNGVQVEKYSVIEDGARILLGGTVSLRFSFMTDDEERAMGRIYDAAMRDGLTGAYNRKALEERLASECAFAQRHQTPLSIVLLDVDDFKAVNDQYGHLAGDAVICEVALRLARAVRTEDVVGRYGGEEFVVVARDIALDKAAQLAERLRRILSGEPVVFEDRAIAVSASFGVASITCCGDKKDVRTLFAIADERLYAAKRAGRNRVVAEKG
jgi:diguanylate cyclase (GGDEF)-like protein